MVTLLTSDETLRKKKMAILCCGVVMYFFTNMSKVLIPGTIFNELQRMGLDVKSISALGAVYMYSYAASQLLAGIFSDRYGGVRILLVGGSMFTAGTIGFPFAEHLWLMYFFRVLTGFGAGTVFLGVAKLLADLFSARFALAMGIILVLGYIGPTVGTMMVFLINAVGWQWAMATPGIIAVTALLGVFALMGGTIKPVTRGQSLGPFFTIVKNKKMWLLWLTSSVVFGSYYVLLAQIGQKSISDFGGVSAEKAATCIMVMTIMVALNNMGVNGIVKLCGNRRKISAVGGILCTLAGGVAGFFAFSNNWGVPGVLLSFFLIAVPAGFFPLYSVIAKELAPPEYTGLSVALINFMAFVFIALFQNISGRILQGFTAVNGVFPPGAYAGIFLFIAIAALPAVISSLLVPETGLKSAEKGAGR
ncbi:MAG: MFS transporter [Lentisphaeria bacterium]|nr:MFS transporter [Lentisphaeria bacterium]